MVEELFDDLLNSNIDSNETKIFNSIAVSSLKSISPSGEVIFDSTQAVTPGNLSTTASHAISSSYALTASYAMNGGGSTDTGSLLKTASFSTPNILFTKGDGTSFNVNISTLNVISASYAGTSSYIDGGTF